METELSEQLTAEMERGGRAYVRNLVAAEQAILCGQFNIAKILRAVAHSQRVMAMEAARLLEQEASEFDLFSTILEEVDMEKDLAAPEGVGSMTGVHLEQSAKVRTGLRDLVQHSLASLQSNPDVLESDVAQSLWVCYSCGAVVEDNRPDICPVCGALSVEFEWFGPFYSATPERLGQLKPEDIIDILEGIPDKVEAVITKVDDAVLQRKPSPDEWCAAEIVGHMLETDMLFAMRAQSLLEAQDTELPRPKPPWKLHEGKGYEKMHAPELMARMRAARSQSLDLVRSLKPEDWSRKGYVQGTRTSMLDLGTWIANHDRAHLVQIQRLCKV